MKHKIRNQKGFTVLELSLASVLVLVLTTAGIYTLNKVSISESNKEQATQNKPAETEKLKVTEAEKTDKVSVPAEEPKAKPTPPPPAPVEKKVIQTETKPTYTSISINMADADINATRALFSASWSGSYSGKCYLTIKNLTTATYISKELAVSGTSCNLEVAKAELPAGSYKYYISFKNNEYTVKGSADYKTFNL